MIDQSVRTPQNELTPALWEAFVLEVKTRTGVHLAPEKAAMLHGRLVRRRRALGLDSLADYLSWLKRDAKEQEEFVHAVTTHKTRLFRTRSVWKHLWNEFLPAFTGRSLSAWSAACSTGEEPASLGAVLEGHRGRTPHFRYSVLATDVSAPVVRTAAQARFRSLPDLPGIPIDACFEPAEPGSSDVQLIERARRTIRFRPHNLFNPLQGRAFDLILLRNVLIYFTASDKERVVRNTARVLKPGGLLVIGESESLVGLECGLTGVGHCLYRLDA